MSRHSLREDILNAGLKVILKSGYQGASVRDICAAAKAPQGSFTNHFPSKEAFVKEVLDRYFEHLKTVVYQALGNRSHPPRQRIKNYLKTIRQILQDAQWNRGCLIGDLSIESSQESELLRKRLAAIFLEWRAPFIDCLAEAQASGEIKLDCQPVDLAEFLLASWQGAILRSKVDQGSAALDRFIDIIFKTIFKDPNDAKNKNH